MSKFIKLTLRESGRTIAIDATRVSKIREFKEGGCVVVGHEVNCEVSQSIDEILAQIGGGEPSVEINAPKVANPFNWVGATHPMTWPCVRCNENHEVPSRGFMCPACVEAMDKEFDLELRHNDPRNVEALKKASNP